MSRWALVASLPSGQSALVAAGSQNVSPDIFRCSVLRSQTARRTALPIGGTDSPTRRRDPPGVSRRRRLW